MKIGQKSIIKLLLRDSLKKCKFLAIHYFYLFLFLQYEARSVIMTFSTHTIPRQILFHFNVYRDKLNNQQRHRAL